MGEIVIQEADPKRPYKAIGSAIGTAVVGSLGALLEYADILPMWVVITATVVMGGLTTYYVPNPMVPTPRL